MNNALKGALFSGLLFPGYGQITLNIINKRGIVLMFTVFAIMIAMVSEAVHYAFIILEKIESEGGATDIQSITDAASQATSNSEHLIYNLGLFLIGICWIFGIADAYRLEKRKDLEEQSARRLLNNE
jgi:cbb3-type cytochrome oxidase subunit 3